MFTSSDPGYVDLTSPAGIGIGAIVYNYDGAVYASDEARMLAEMGDMKFKLGQLNQNSYEEIFLSPNDRKSTRPNSSHYFDSRMQSSALKKKKNQKQITYQI